MDIVSKSNVRMKSALLTHIDESGIRTLLEDFAQLHDGYFRIKYPAEKMNVQGKV